MRGVLFDAGGVLVRPVGGRWNPRYDFEAIVERRHPAVIGRDLGDAFAAGQRVLDAGSTTADRTGYHRAILRELGVGAPSAELLRELEAPAAGPVIELYPDARPALERLRATGVAMAVVSDTWAGLDETFRQLGVAEFFAGFVISELMGCRKPDPRMYAAGSELLGLTPGECLFIDDDPELVAAAIALGYQGLTLDRDAERPAAGVVTSLDGIGEAAVGCGAERPDGPVDHQQVAGHAGPPVTGEFDRHAGSVPAQRTYEKDNPVPELNAERARQAIVEHTRRLAESAATAGPDAAVPTTPQWTITELVEHVGQTQNWVAEIIERRITDPTQLPIQMAVLPADPREWQTWLSQSAQRVASACSDDALDAPVFNAAGDERSGTRFWMFSVLNEAVVHGFDAAGAAGRPAATDADIAAALISNHLTMLASPTWEMQRPESAHAIRGSGQTLQWLATDTEDDAGAWFVERRPDGVTWQPGIQPADVTVAGPARSLLLTLTRRLPLTDRKTADISVDGDTGLVQHWLDNTAHVSG